MKWRGARTNYCLILSPDRDDLRVNALIDLLFVKSHIVRLWHVVTGGAEWHCNLSVLCHAAVHVEW